LRVFWVGFSLSHWPTSQATTKTPSNRCGGHCQSRCRRRRACQTTWLRAPAPGARKSWSPTHHAAGHTLAEAARTPATEQGSERGNRPCSRFGRSIPAHSARRRLDRSGEWARHPLAAAANSVVRAPAGQPADGRTLGESRAIGLALIRAGATARGGYSAENPAPDSGVSTARVASRLA
jgi:hypothetical protein